MRNFANEYDYISSIDSAESFRATGWSDCGSDVDGEFCFNPFEFSDALCSLLAIATPFIIGWRLIKFRNYALDGIISFRRALAYSWYTFFYAAVLFAVVQYLYFKFLDHGVLIQLMNETAQILIPIYKAQGLQETEIQNAIAMFGSLTPIQLAFMFMMQNIFIGLVLSLPIAAVCMRKTHYGSPKIK